ncbi:sarcosine oxidase subunit gamma [Aquibaculum arenosum]|uniref:Sarcosine oxidase subunit gamma family protein n=1 Tax=Aquibaculum arenosum TaxID=3032591 RepID=A0ABT5YI27_9PROT|nr:sarcosine oxidase subunit gamma family protein [Fodinicurvata sp. CAU 1616]MDF2094590.1 sarcosine oxidase subunit gamma family protein [Fodinicurvata sp. CAU 1616]
MPERLSALEGAYHPGLHGTTDPAAARLSSSERRGLSVALVSCFPEDREAVAATLRELVGLELPAPSRAHENEAGALLWQGPDRWLVVVPEDKRPDLVRTLRDAFADRPAVAVADINHARCVIRIAGTKARDLLAKGCGLDLIEESFPAGHCALTRFGHQAVTLHARAREEIDLYVTRSFALALWEELLDLGAEYGLRVEEPLR